MVEEYKTVEGFENYQISNLGNIKRLDTNSIDSKGRKRFYKGKQLILTLGTNGYYQVTLRRSNKQYTRYIHQLVAIAFLNHSPDKLNIVVDHIDGNPLNNIVTNLQLISQQKNTSKYHAKGELSNIKKNSANKYEVNFLLDNSKIYFGPFVLLEEAIKVRDFVMNNKDFVRSIRHLSAKERVVSVLKQISD